MSEEIGYFVTEVESIITSLVNLKTVIKELIRQIKEYSRTGMQIDEELLETLFNTYYQIAIKASELHKQYVINPFILSGEPPQGMLEAIHAMELKDVDHHAYGWAQECQGIHAMELKVL